MLWSFSRDGGIPFHRLWSAINPTSGTPILAVWAMVTFAFLLGLPMLHSTAAFQAVTSISTIGLYISCKSRSTPHLTVDIGCLDLLPGMPCILVFIPQEFIAAIQHGIALCKPSSNKPKAFGSTPQWRTHDPYLSCLVKLQASHLQGRIGFIREGEWGTW